MVESSETVVRLIKIRFDLKANSNYCNWKFTLEELKKRYAQDEERLIRNESVLDENSLSFKNNNKILSHVVRRKIAHYHVNKFQRAKYRLNLSADFILINSSVLMIGLR